MVALLLKKKYAKALLEIIYCHEQESCLSWHIALKHHYIRGAVEDKEVDVLYYKTEDQVLISSPRHDQRTDSST